MRRDLPEDSKFVLRVGLLDRIGSLLVQSGFDRCVVVTDHNVATAWRPALQAGLTPLRQDWIVVPAGEEHKTLDHVRDLYGRLLGLDVERQTPVLAFGGGVVGDLAGFVAATWLRGVPFFQVPTTLVAMVDSSHGGKTGVDLPEGKNLVGAWYPARAIWADPRTLRTLPRKQWASGMVEAVKHALLASPRLLEQIEAFSRPADPSVRQDSEIQELVSESARIKRGIVRRDPWESGERVLLNLGHTLGHALERAGDYARFTHGEAVGLGLLAALRLAGRRAVLPDAWDLLGRVESLLAAWDLPRAIPASIRWEVVAAGLRRDKKRLGGRLVFVLPTRLGRAEVFEVDEAEVRRVFEELQAAEGSPELG